MLPAALPKKRNTDVEYISVMDAFAPPSCEMIIQMAISTLILLWLELFGTTEHKHDIQQQHEIEVPCDEKIDIGNRLGQILICIERREGIFLVKEYGRRCNECVLRSRSPRNFKKQAVAQFGLVPIDILTPPFHPCFFHVWYNTQLIA